MNNHFNLIDYVLKKYKFYFNGEISLVEFWRKVLEYIQLHYREYESIFLIKFLKKLLQKSSWKTEYDPDCWIYKPDYPMPWLGCMLGDDYSFFHKDGQNKYMEEKKYVESKVYTPLEALEMIESRWDVLCKKEIGYHALKYCLVNTKNHQNMLIGLNVLKVIIGYLVVDIKRYFTTKNNRKYTAVKKEVITEEGDA